MLRPPFQRFVIPAILAAFCALALALPAEQHYRERKYKAPPPTARIEVTVVRAAGGKPIENAAVVFTLTTEKGSMELKTGSDGKTVIDVLPIGSGCRLQVFARGFQSYGEDFQIDRPELLREIRLQRPGEQVSIYTTTPGSAAKGASSQPGEGKP